MNLSKLPRRLAIATGATLLALMALWAWAQTDMVPSRLQPELSRSKVAQMSQAERWQLDYDLMDEAYMKEHNSVRFPGPSGNSWDQRAAWMEELAQWYPVADAMQQLIDYRRSVMFNNQRAMRRLYDLGQAGDVSAACMAASLYRHHLREVTDKWALSYETVVMAAMRFKDSGHRGCISVEGGLYLRGEAGYPKDEKLGLQRMIASAAAGSVGNQKFLIGQHIAGAERLEPKSVALQICWSRVVDTKIPWASGENKCWLYRRGIKTVDGRQVAMPPDIHRLAIHWCSPSLPVTPETCANLESEPATQLKETKQ